MVHPTYTGCDGNQHPMPMQVCKYCGENFPAIMPMRYGHKECQDPVQNEASRKQPSGSRAATSDGRKGR